MQLEEWVTRKFPAVMGLYLEEQALEKEVTNHKKCNWTRDSSHDSNYCRTHDEFFNG